MTDRAFSFAYPWLLLLLLVPLALAWMLGGRGAMPVIRFSSLAALRPVGHAARAGFGGVGKPLALLALAAFIVALARPRLGKQHDVIESSGVDIVLTLDVSPSMRAEDFTLGGQQANRLDAVKEVTRRFIDGRPNDRIGIVAFAKQPFVVSPITLNHDYLQKNLERIRIGILGDGTAIGTAIVSAANRLKDKPSKSKVMILLTDGSETVPTIKPNTAAEAAKAVGIRIYTIGAGSDSNAQVPGGFFSPFSMRRRAEFDEESLRQIAEIGGGQYFRATDTASLQKIFEQIDKLEKTEVKLNKFTEWWELFPWFVGTGAGLMLLHLLVLNTIGRRLP